MLKDIFYRKGKVTLFVICGFLVSNVGTICFASVPDDGRPYICTPEENRLIVELFSQGYGGASVANEMEKRGYSQAAVMLKGMYGTDDDLLTTHDDPSWTSKEDQRRSRKPVSSSSLRWPTLEDFMRDAMNGQIGPTLEDSMRDAMHEFLWQSGPTAADIIRRKLK
jgi:hypothetical protein